MCPLELCSDLLPTCSCPRSYWMPLYVKCTCTYIGCTLCISTQCLCKLKGTYNGIQVCMKSYLIFYKLKFQQDFCLKFQISVAEKRLIIEKFKYRRYMRCNFINILNTLCHSGTLWLEFQIIIQILWNFCLLNHYTSWYIQIEH